MTAWRLGPVLISHWRWASLLGCSFFGTILLARAVYFLPRPRLHDPQGESGTLSEEMVLAFPFFLLFFAITIQMILLMNAVVVVNYAAFLAARSASVWVPTSIWGEGSNTIQLTSQSGGLSLLSGGQPSSKLDRIQAAAAFGCAPISPNYFTWTQAYLRRFQYGIIPISSSAFSSIGSSLGSLASAFNGSGDSAVTQVSRLVPRLIYSTLYTSVSIDNQSQNMLQVGPQDNLLVTVEHKFYVAIPFVGRILGTSYSSLGSVGPIQINVSDIYYIPIQESYTIRNEGEQLYPGY